MDIIALYQDFNIPYLTEGNTHCAEGWVQINCPWCSGSQNYHLGYNLEDNYYSCYRCGWHPVVSTIARLINMSEEETKTIVKKYGLRIRKITKEPEVTIKNIQFKLPSGVGRMGLIHELYLTKRKFDPDKLEKEWGLLGTGPLSRLSTGKGENEQIIDYKFRIIIPFIWNGKQVSFDSRDVTGKAPNRYQACPKDREIIPHKNILYGKQEKWKQTGICVEGPTDVWRFGVNSFAVSGIKFTPKQVREISKNFKRVPVCFDDDPQAIVQANKLIAELRFRGVDSFPVTIEGDPGSMDQDEADYLVKQLIS